MSSNIFTGGDEKNKDFASKVDTHSKTLVTIIQRQKDIESLLENIHEKIDLIDHNAVSDFKKVFVKTKQLGEDISDLKVEIQKIKDFNEKIPKQLKLFATVDEVKKLEKYVDLFDTKNKKISSHDSVFDAINEYNNIQITNIVNLV